MSKLPSIVLGTWSWGTGTVGGDQVFGNNLTSENLKPVFDTAMKSSLNAWDTATVYGMGASEDILGTFVKLYPREEVYISTKFTPQIAPQSPNSVQEMLNASLKRFDTDYVDMYWIHNPADVEKWTPGLIPLVKSGKVKHVGVSNHNLEQIKRVEEILSPEGVHLSAIQNHYSLLYRSSEKAGILDYCRENNIEFWAYMVLEQGALSGKYDTRNPLPKESMRGGTYNPLLPQIEKLVEAMRNIGRKYNVSPAQIALAWAMAKGTTLIIGVTQTVQVEDAIKSSEIKLDKEEIYHIEQAADSAGVDTKGSWENPMH